jgi:hypothetical protein
MADYTAVVCGDVTRSAWLPLGLLVAYGIAFAARALGTGPSAFDDHPGQLARLWHVVREGPAPWAWNARWWAGYPEMQFYPPGWFYAGALLSWLTLGAVTPPVGYQLMLWVTYLAPGVSAFFLLRRLLGDAWCALPGAFLVLTFAGDPAGGAASGVEGGVHMGMVAARAAWALLPLLALTLAPWSETGGPFPRAAVLLVAAIIFTHPAHTPTAVAMLVAGALAGPSRRRALVQAGGALVVALVLVAFWLLPLLHHLDDSRALAWGALALAPPARTFAAVLVALALVAVSRHDRRRWSAALHAVWLAALGVAVDALVLEPLGVRFLPADRVADGAWMTLLMAGGLGAGVLVGTARHRLPRFAAALTTIAVLVVFSLPGRTLILWPRASDWPSYPAVTRGLRLDALWRTVSAAPPGRVLFIRSGVPLVYGPEWYRPHTHVTALTPVMTGREIVGGTFTHGSPIAALVYRGDASRAPIAQLAERLDGRTLFGRPLDTLDGDTFERYARRLRISTVVALEDDAGHLPFLIDNPRYRRATQSPFLVFTALEPVSPPRHNPSGWWEAPLIGASDGWASTGIAYYSLWHAELDGRPVPTRRGEYGDVEVKIDPTATVVRLFYGPGVVELGALALSAVGLVGFAGLWLAGRGSIRAA